MSETYDKYIREHTKAVKECFAFLEINIPEIFQDAPFMTTKAFDNVVAHDNSKYSKEEYNAYDDYFYGEKKTPEIESEFNRAWLHHIHNNPHHWQYWVLINDDSELGTVTIDMPYEYIIEMICDWWSFSWKSGNLYEIFDWYENKKEYIKLSVLTRQTVNYILDKIKETLDRMKADEQ